MNSPKILVFDIETSPIISYTWGIWDQNVSLNMIKEDWYILSWGAKWLDSDKTMYMDSRGSKNISDDSKLLKGIWKLLDECDIVITQNGKSFDVKKLNARFILNGMQPPSEYRHIDTLQLAKKHFGFTSNKLEYMADKINTKYKKLKHDKFAGFELWKECLKGNLKAWNEMKKYNIHDVLSLEELYKKIIPWDTTFNFNAYSDNLNNTCTCGSTSFIKKGFRITNTAKYQSFKCTKCGAKSQSKVNLLTADKKKALKDHKVK